MKRIGFLELALIPYPPSEELGLKEEDSERIILQAQNSPPEKEPGQIFEGVGEIPTIISKLRNEANVI